MHPGMPPTNNDTERDIRDAVVVQRKIRRRFVNARGRHVFSVIEFQQYVPQAGTGPLAGAWSG